MSDYEFGTEGMWKFAATMVVVGILATAGGIVWAIVQLVRHLRWVS